jgi:large subunit ribosomal protein L16
MAMMPKRVKYRKFHKGRVHGRATRGNTVSYGEFGIQTEEAGRISANVIEAGRMAATHYLHREGRVYIRIFPQKSITGKPLETRMGKGKGEVTGWIAVVKPGTILYEIGGVPEETARMAFQRVAHKMPVRTRFVQRQRI